MAERPVLVGLIPQAVVLDAGDQVSWISDAGNMQRVSGAGGNAALERSGAGGDERRDV